MRLNWRGHKAAYPARPSGCASWRAVGQGGGLPAIGSFKARGLGVAEGREKVGGFDLSTLKAPYRIEGKKTMELEPAEQLGWRLPDVIFYPTGGGTGVIGMWKAFAKLEAIGWISGQASASGCRAGHRLAAVLVSGALF